MRDYGTGQTQAMPAGQAYGGATTTGAHLGMQSAQNAAANLVKERDPSALESLERDLMQIAERIGQVNSRVSGITNRMFGSRIEGINKAEQAPQPQSMLARVADQINRLRAYIAYTEEELSRLEQL